MAAAHNLYVDQGADFSAEVGVYDDNNNSWDLTGYSGVAKIKKSYSSTTATDFTVTIAATGTVTLKLSATTTASMSEGRYLYDVVITSPSAKKTRVIEGIVTVNPGVTI